MPAMSYTVALVLFVVILIALAILTGIITAVWPEIPRVRKYKAYLDRLPLLKAEYDRLLAKRSDAERVIEEAEWKGDLLENLREELATLEPKRVELQEVKERLTKRREDLAEAGGELSDLKETLDRHRSVLAGLQGEVESNQRELDRTREAEAEAKTRALELERQVGALTVRLAAGQEDLSQLQARLERVGGEAQQAESALRDLQAEHAQLRPAVESLKQQERDAEARMTALAEQLRVFEETYKGTMDKLDSQWTASIAEWRRSQDQTLKQVARQWEELKNHIEKAVEVINGTWDRLRPPQAAEASEKYRDLWEPVLGRSDLDDGPDSADERTALNETAQYLKELGLVYPERTLNAFHTCLKVNEMSPLTVLAGISGTGKSLLPRRYAEGMGIHFLNVAIQPRWDSPQDLFGFYNYVESRYKGTELARVLIQTERYNRELFNWDVRDRLDDRMVLVLLDEMNLARVEYYFSEFLSRLETRRGVDPRDAGQRRAAEIVFEMGALGKGESEIRVFPDTNVLFTGTMNEDETTQTLSDKVLDRANVLRFGKPARLAFEGQDTDKALSTATALSFKAWGSWLRDPSVALAGARQTTLDEWTHRLNGVMGDLGRPFGHRVARGIAQYVANYPKEGDTALKAGFADQIEQRIMPRLRGLDPREHAISTAFDSLGDLLKKLDDPLLVESFEQGRRGDLFLWAGVDRAAEGA